MKSITRFSFILLYWQTVASQTSIVTTTGALPVNSPSFYLDYLKDEAAADLFTIDIYAGVEGSPFLSNDWMYARIKLADNRSFDSVFIKLNLFENKIHFKDESGREKMLAARVKEIELRDSSSKWNHTVFVSGYGDDKNVFYQVLADGKKAGLLKKMNVIITEMKVYNGPVQKKFEQQERFYVFLNGALYQESKSCSSLMTVFGKDSQVAGYISSNNIRCNKEQDLLKLVEFYNSL